MRLKNLVALVVLAHALVHPLAHVRPAAAGSPAKLEAPSSSEPGAQLSAGVACPACLGLRNLLADPAPLLAAPLRWQPVAPLPPAPVLPFYALAPSSRAPPLA